MHTPCLRQCSRLIFAFGNYAWFVCSAAKILRFPLCALPGGLGNRRIGTSSVRHNPAALPPQAGWGTSVSVCSAVKNFTVSTLCVTGRVREPTYRYRLYSAIVRRHCRQNGKRGRYKTFLCIFRFRLTPPRQPGPDGRCRCRKPCKLCGALRAHRTWGKPQRWEQTASS